MLFSVVHINQTWTEIFAVLILVPASCWACSMTFTNSTCEGSQSDKKNVCQLLKLASNASIHGVHYLRVLSNLLQDSKVNSWKLYLYQKLTISHSLIDGQQTNFFYWNWKINNTLWEQIKINVSIFLIKYIHLYF